MTVDVADVERQWRGAVTRSRRRRTRYICAAAVLLVAGLVAMSATDGVDWVETVWLVGVGATFLVFGMHPAMGGADIEAAELEPVDVLDVTGRHIVVRTRAGHTLRWPIRRTWGRPRPRPGAAFATTPVRRLHPSTLVTWAGTDVRWYHPAQVAVSGGDERPAVVVDAERDAARDAEYAARVRAADPAALLAQVAPRAVRGRRQWVAAVAVYVAALVSWIAVAVLTGGDTSPLVVQVALMSLATMHLGRAQVAAAAALTHATHLELVDVVESARFDDRVRIRTADGRHLAWTASTTGEPLPRTGPLWVTAPVETGRRLTVVLPHGRDGARYVGAATKAVDAPALRTNAPTTRRVTPPSTEGR